VGIGVLLYFANTYLKVSTLFNLIHLFWTLHFLNIKEQPLFMET